MLFISVISGLIVTIVKKYYVNNTGSASTYIFLYNGVSGLFSLSFFFLFYQFSAISEYSIILGVLYGLATIVQGVFMMLAFLVGPVSFTVVIVNFSTVLTAVSGAIFWGESIKFLQIIGIGLCLASFLLAIEKKDDEKKVSWKWMVYSSLAMLATATLGLLQKIHQNSIYKEELDGFLFVAFAFLTITSLIAALFLSKKEKVPFIPKVKEKKILYAITVNMVVAGIFIAIVHKLNLYLAGVIDSAIFFPIVNGGNLILSILLARILFKEKLTRRQWIGVFVGIASFACLCF